VPLGVRPSLLNVLGTTENCPFLFPQHPPAHAPSGGDARGAGRGPGGVIIANPYHRPNIARCGPPASATMAKCIAQYTAAASYLCPRKEAKLIV
jgi:hypothetical protein